MSVASQPKQLQFSIRTLLVLMSVVAAIAAACGWWIHTSRAQRLAINAVASKGGFVWLDKDGSYVDIEFGVPLHEGCGQIILLAGPHGKQPTFADNDLTMMSHIWRLRRVSLANTRVSPQAIEQFRESHPHISVTQ
ncbi:MAG: hypothetical protein L0211_22310 [Planctomycetaceae bacterium]|nr:hypothetical protein [Planctomycetaceae bacterium]